MSATTLRYRSCTRKRGYDTDEEAQRVRDLRMRAEPGLELFIYRCPFCRRRHLTSTRFSFDQRNQLRRDGRRQAARAR